NVAIAVCGFEAAGPVSEAALPGDHMHGLKRDQVKGLQRQNCFADFLPVCSNVLYRSRSDAAWYAGKAFNPGVVHLNAMCDERVPFLTRAGGDNCLVTLDARFHSADRDAQNQTRKTVVRDDRIA